MKPARLFACLWTSLVAVFVAVVTAIAQSPVAPPQGSPNQSGRSQAPGDGIKVHGLWTIDVRNADGTLASHNEFQNALEPSGASTLSALLGRSATLAGWQLDLIGANAGGPCVRTDPVPSGASSIRIGLPPLSFNPVDNTWDSDGQLTPGAPVSSLVGESVFQIPFDPASPLNVRLDVIDPEGDAFDVLVGNYFPGLALVNGETLQFSSFGVAPGTYGTTLTLRDSGGLSNVYELVITLGSNQPPPTGGLPYPCSAVEPGTVIGGDLTSAWFPTLAFSQVTGPGGTPALELTGNVTASSTEQIEQVRSVMVLSSGARTPFSSKTLGTPIQVAVGQKIYVKVLLSFS